MSRKERERLTVMVGVAERKLMLQQAATLMGVGYRQSKRTWKRNQAEGDAGLVHRLRGKPSARRKPANVRARALALYAEERNADSGPTLMAEQLAQAGLAVDNETLRRWRLREEKVAVGRRLLDVPGYTFRVWVTTRAERAQPACWFGRLAQTFVAHSLCRPAYECCWDEVFGGPPQTARQRRALPARHCRPQPPIRSSMIPRLRNPPSRARLLRRPGLTRYFPSESFHSITASVNTRHGPRVKSHGAWTLWFSQTQFP